MRIYLEGKKVFTVIVFLHHIFPYHNLLILSKTVNQIIHIKTILKYVDTSERLTGTEIVNFTLT